MILPSKLINALKKDHTSLKAQLSILKDEETDILKLKETFLSVASQLISHSKREEQVVYKFMLTNADLRQMALTGKEEHRLLEILIAELEFQGFGEKWFAKAKVFAELLEHHLSEEESRVFPVLKKYLDSEIDELLCSKYQYPEGSSDYGHGEYVKGFFYQQKPVTTTFLQMK